jgi:hypothetical protein
MTGTGGEALSTPVITVDAVIGGSEIVLFGVAVARSGLLPRWSGIGLAIAGVLFGPVGFVIGPVQTAGAALLVVVAAWLAGAGQRAQTADERDAGGTRLQGVAEASPR